MTRPFTLLWRPSAKKTIGMAKPAAGQPRDIGKRDQTWGKILNWQQILGG